MSKVCTKCGNSGEFYKDSTHKDGFSSVCKSCKQEHQTSYYTLNKIEINKRNLNRYYAKNYGVNVKQKNDMFVLQDYRCAICGTSYSKQWNLDHNHKTNQNRAILCNDCNFMLGLAKDKPEILELAAAYLRGFQHVY